MRAPKILSLLFLSVAWAEATHASKSIENAKPEIDKDSQRTYKESSGFERSRRQAYYDNRESVLRENEENDILDQIQTATATDLGSSFNFRAQFSQGYIDLGSRDLVEEGAATLAFVFDTTGSMTDDMQQVIVGAGEILNTVLEKFDRPIHNYVFVPFHDPEVGPVTATTDPERFQESLKESYIFGGGDCPEMAIKAIRIALDISLPHSYVYVFTDARAKDYYLLDEVLQIIQKKQSQVVFVMTGDCGNHTHPGYQAFEDIASTSSGQIFHLDKGNVKEVLDFVRVSLESRKVNLLSFNREDFGPGEENIPLLIDPTLKQFTISVSGEKPKIEIYDAAGRYIKEEEGVEHLLDLENVKIVGVKQPSPGQYNISVGSESKFTVRATGVSSLSFDHGFSLYPTTDFKETYHRPMTGETSYVLVKPSDVTEFGDLIRLQMISLDGRILEDLPLTRLPGSLPVYNGTAFLTPDQPFNLKIFGRDKHGYEFERISSTAVSSQEPSLPEVNSLNEVTGYTSRPAIITCHVHTLLPFTLLWQKNGLYIGTEQSYPQSSEVHYIVNSASQEDEGQYTCIANNSVGTASSDVYLDVKEPPPHVVASKTVTVFSTQPAVLTCHVTSAVEYNITWSRYVEKGQIKDFFGKTETIGDFVSVDELEGYQVLANDSLVLERPSSQHEGWFRCTAANEGGRQSREVHVTVQSLPEVTVLPEVLGYRRGDNITLSCLGQGLPHPILTWSRDDVSLTESTDGSASQIELHVSLATRDDEGMYTCTASSSSGTATAVSTLRYTEAPQVVPFEEELFVRNGETVKLQCLVAGIPQPTLQWVKDGTPLVPMSFIQMEDDYLKILGVQENDAGQYTCRATNWAGADEAQISLRVGAAPTVIQAPTDAELDIGSMGGFSCYGVGVPEPSITWYKADGSYLPSHFAQDGDGNLRIKGVQLEDEGTYKCIIENQYGRLQMQASLFISGLMAPVVAVPQVPHLEVTKGSAVTLPCIVVMADPPPQITWYYEGSPIYSGTGDMVIDDDGSLKIPVVKSKDEGRYQCVATNVAGNSSLTLTLSVLVPPRAKNNRGEENIVVLKGDVVRLKCPVKADPKPTFSWTKDGQPLPFDSRRVRVSKKNGIIMIKQARQSDAGTYVCIAKNAAGTTSIPVNLQVNDEPEISPAGDEILTVLAGQDLKLPCEVTGHPQPYVAWQKDGQSFGETVNLQPGPGYLLMSNVTPSMAAVYTCTAYNSVGEAKKEFTVYVNYAPVVEEIHEYTPEKRIVEGGQLSLPCHAEAHPIPTKDWSKDGQKLHPTPDLIISNSGTVEVSHAAPQHSGSYRCTLRNMLGEAHIDYEVEVIVPPRALLQNWQEATMVVEGDEVVIRCPVDAVPLPDITWFKDGVSIHSTKDRADLTHLIIEENGHILHILEVSIADNGTYVCVAKNDAGETEVSYHLEVLVAPRFSQFYHNPEIELRVGQELFLDCHATGNPKPQVSWVHNGSPLEDSVTSSGSQVSVLRVSSSHAGFYTCTVQNTAGTIQRNFNVTVLVPPIFEDNKNHQNNVNAVKGTDTQLDCRVSGSPPPAVSWMKNGLPLAHWPDLQHQLSPDGQVLNLLQVDAHSSGVYRCAAKNSLGTRHKLFNMTVLTPPSIRREDGKADDLVEEIDVVAGEEVILYCPAEGTPRPTITWLKEEKILPSSESPQHLLLYDAQEKDSGDYTCLASNPVGSVEKQFAVRVIVPARITNLKKDMDRPDTKPYQEAMVDTPFSLYCPVVGSPLPNIMWSKNGIVIEKHLEQGFNDHISFGEDGQLLLVSSATVEDSGNYTCYVQNTGGSDSVSYVVAVQVPPHIMQEIDAPLTYVEGEDVSLYCEVEGTTPLSIVWLLDGVGLEDLRLPGITVDEDFTVMEGNLTLAKSVVNIEDVSEIHSGPYTCIASNGAGSDEFIHSVDVATPPRVEDDSTDTNVVVMVNRPAILTCEAESNPEPYISWLKNSEPLEENPNMHVSLDGRELKLLQVREQDTGNYSCLAVNVAGAIFINHTLQVQVPPHLQGEVKENVHAKAGEDVELFCPVYATPQPSILWMNESTILQETFTIINPQRLVLRSVSKDDAGRYSCLATNEAGTLEQDFNLHVMTAPKLVDLEKPVVEKSVVANRLVTVSCYVVADPLPAIRWLKDGKPLPSTSTVDLKFDNQDRHLTLLRATPADSGNYTCQATNAAGTTTLTTLLSVHTPPTWNPDSDLEEEITALEGENLELFCDVEANPFPSILWLKNGQVISPVLKSNDTEDDRLLRVIKLDDGDSGRYVCVASNAAGTGKFEFEVTVLAHPSLTYEPQTNHTVLQNHLLSLECPVDGSPKPSIQWLINGLPVSSSDKYIQLSAAQTQLHILRVLSSMAGQISCVASNSVGELMTNYTLNVLTPPVITSTPSSRQAKVYEGGLLTLSCHSSGNPRPQVAWLVGDGRMLTESELLDSGLELHEVNQSLIILEANKGHQGHYTCVVSNPAGSAEDTFFVEVLVPPVIREPEGSTSLEVMQSSTITLLCVVDARPRATITWFKDGREIDGRQDPFLHVTGNGEQLKFLRTLSSHTANYTCKAANEAGEDHLNFQVQVMVPPIIIEDLVENAIGGGIGGKTLGVVGRTMDLECYVIGTPTPTVTWTRDIQEIEVNDHLELLEGGQVLRLHHAQTNDSGHYTCTANSTSGTAGRDFLVVIHRRPLITPPSEKNLEVVLNDPLTLTCEVDSSLTPAVSWIRHGQPITPFLNPNFQVRSEGRELHLRRVRKGDGGAFTCVAVNAAGQDTLTYNIAVQVPAVIERANTQSRVIGVAGQSVEFVCEASGSPRPSLSWVHDDTLVTPDHPHYQILDKGKRLQVKEVLLEDEGTISCTASNTAGQDTFNFTLEVMVPPYLPDEAVTDITVKEGDSIILECPVEATPSPTVTWERDGSPIDINGKGNINTERNGQWLRVVRAGSHNTGVYTCTSTNLVGLLDVDLVLNVLVLPEIVEGRLSVVKHNTVEGLREMEVVTVTEGGHAVLECYLRKGFPAPNRTWTLYPNTSLPLHFKVMGGGERVVVSKASVEDAGIYSCLAHNQAGQDSKLIKLEVYSPPRINMSALPSNFVVLHKGNVEAELPTIGQPQNSTHSAAVTITHGQTITLPCPVTGYPLPRRLWYQGSQALVSSSKRVVGTGGRDLTLVGVGPRDVGIYVCVAVNPAGEAQLTTSLHVISVPELEGQTNEELMLVEGENTILECRVKPQSAGQLGPGIQSHYNITWTKSGQRLEQDTLWSEEIELVMDSPTNLDQYYDYDNSTFSPEMFEDFSSQSGWHSTTYPEEDNDRQLDGAHYTISTDGSRLFLPLITKQEEGMYSCQVANEAGTTHKTFRLDVLVPPDIQTEERPFRHYNVTVGKPLVLECDAQGDPPPEVIWSHGGSQLKPSSRLQMLEEGHILFFTSVEEDDDGDYMCQAVNVVGATDETFHLNVFAPPKVSGPPETKVSVLGGQPVAIECDLEGRPKPDYIWMYNGDEVTSDDVIVVENLLTIDSTTLDHAGDYQCEAINSVGHAVKTFKLQVKEPPIIVGGTQEEVVSVLEGETASLHCHASGSPEPIISWSKEEEEVGVWLLDQLKMYHEGSNLQIQHVKREDAGYYTCLASNVAGNDTKQYLLQVLMKPELLAAEDEVRVVLGEETLLSCLFGGIPAPQITWYFKGEPREHGEIVKISPARSSDMGNYSCVAENEAGQASHTTQLIVHTYPSVEAERKHVVAISGTEVTLRCRTKGQPAPTIRWFKAHQMISSGPEFEVKDDGSLHLPLVLPSLADTYVCTGQNRVGSASDHMQLVVQEPPVALHDEQKEVTATEGQEAVLTCDVTGSPTPTITWARPNMGHTPVTPENPRIKISGKELIILSVVAEDAGSYECTAQNPAGHTNAQLLLTVHSPPSVQEGRNESVSLKRGEELRLSCTVSGLPQPRTSWLKDGRILSNTARVLIQPNGGLVVSRIQASDSGVYTCLATNLVGRLYRDVEVDVLLPPTFVALPRSTEVTQGQRFELECEAVGNPIPSIQWLLNGVQVDGVTTSLGGWSHLVVEHASKTDEGTYTCLAENEAGHKKAIAAVQVKVPPIIMYGPEETTVLELSAVTLVCVAEGDPVPSTTWIKEGHSLQTSDRVTLTPNGSLIINASQASDAGEYKCVVSNGAGAAEATAHLVVHTAPVITTPPVAQVVEVGSMVVFDCVAEGSPVPDIQWNVSPGDLHSRFQKLTNGSLQLIAAQMEDEGQVICQAYNDLGEDLAKASLYIKVPGFWGSWGSWSPCSVSCGPGQQLRRRECDSPAPRHGGAPCQGAETHTRPCRPQPCPVDGNWSPWEPWSDCSATCGEGVQIRSRHCTAPVPLYDGKPCEGSDTQEEKCHLKDCPVSGQWGSWSSWSDCSTSCGQGLKQRSRLCDSPPPSGGGAQCEEDSLEVTPCSSSPCLLDGSWGTWEAWSVCSVSCGGGVRRRLRNCRDPLPSNGGRYCPGSDTQEDYCNFDLCPVNGGWSSWSPWGACTATCGGGQRRRFRTCDSPPPSQGGRACTGSDADTEACNTQQCPVNGEWGLWGEWSSCSESCGIGIRTRRRLCDAPYPRMGGSSCSGEETETGVCLGHLCKKLPEVARGTLMGELNGEDLGIVKLLANVSTLGMQRTVTGNVSPVIPKHGAWLTPLLSLLSPVYWIGAYEINGAVNGHTLTEGFFRQEAHVAFATGETIDMTHVVRGVDSDGTLLVDVVVTGNVPYLPPGSPITLHPYTETYVQTGSGSLFVTSTRAFSLGHHQLPYAWNKTISYDADLGSMPFLVETLHTNGLGTSYSNIKQELTMVASASITPGTPSQMCPSGFTLNEAGRFCQDNNECGSSSSRCSHGCTNTVGSYVCTCSPGYTLGPDGYTCQDMDECSMPGVCGPQEQCENSPGSYICTYACGHGLRRTSSGSSCEDVNECEEQPGVCDQTCLNLIGGYRCDCRRGFRLVGQSRCVDIDECSTFRSPCSHSCENTVGSFKCTCPEGYSVLRNGRCKDIDECRTHQHNCLEEQECENTEGSYTCITNCPLGLKQASNVTCTDIDECEERLSGCHYTQICTNTWGSYVCSCAQGFRSAGPGQPCLDIDECKLRDRCQHQCHNTHGSYVCLCPPGYRLNHNQRTCDDIDECIEQSVKCGVEEVCFNQRGSYRCVAMRCPPGYQRDLPTGSCILDCRHGGVSCPPGVNYAHILAFKTASLPAGIKANQDLVRLMAYDQLGNLVPQTLFTIIENESGVRFRIRVKNGRGILRTLQPLVAGREYRMIVEAVSYDEREHFIKYSTRFIIFLHISEYPY